MREFILDVRPLTDDTLFLADEGKVFKGGYVGIIHYYTFQTAWSDKKHEIKFRKKERLIEYVKKHYPEFDLIDL